MAFKYLVCLDFEATCWYNGLHRDKAEIIEIAAVLLNIETGATDEQFHSYVRPTRRPRLSQYCVRLTGINQSLVDYAEPFPIVYKKFIDWLQSLQEKNGLRYTSLAGIRASDDGPNTSFCSWTNSDLGFFFRKDCEHNRILCEGYLKAWIDIQKRCEIIYPVYPGRSRKFSKALERANINPAGRAHSGLSDARNLATLVSHLVERGLRFSTANEYYI